MNKSQQVYERLQRANPLSDTSRYEPTADEAAAFLAAIREGTMANDGIRIETTEHTPHRWVVAVAAFAAVLLIGGVAGFLVAGDGSETAAGATTTTTASVSTTAALFSGTLEVTEPVELADLRNAVNRGDAAAAARIHSTDADCDRFFTTGAETCTDWYVFLVGIGTEVVTVDCELGPGEATVSCYWTVESDVHRSLGIDSVTWEFTNVGIDGWSAVQPDGNLLTGIPGLGQLDVDFWAHVAGIVETEGDDTTALSNRVPATLNGDFAAVVLDAAESFERTD